MTEDNKFWKNHNTQHALLRMIETWNTKLNVSDKVGPICMFLPKPLDSRNNELLIAKLKCCGLDKYAVEFVRIYLSDRYQSCKIPVEIGEKLQPV